jgi:hypothetical protein
MARARFLLLVVTAAGCNDPTYLSERRPLETHPALSPSMTGYADDSDLYVLPVRRPTPDERTALAGEQRRRNLPMPVPWAGTRDFSIEIEYSVKNLESRPVQAFFKLDGGNEFGDYVPAAYIDPNANPEDQVTPPSLQGGSPIELAANEVKPGVFREDQLDEAAIDLEAIIRYPNPNAVRDAPFIVIEHLSSASALGLEFVPSGDVTPAMVRYRFTLSADGHVVADYSVRVRDRSDKLATPGARGLFVSTAGALAPPVAPQPAAAP